VRRPSYRFRSRGPVLRVRLRADGVAGEWVEWVAPRSQHCRREGEQVELATPTNRAVISPESWGPNAGAWVRAGSKEFVHGPLWPPCAALALAEDAVGEARLRWKGRELTAAVEERISAEEATARPLFAFDESAIRSYDVERALASAPPGMRAYWLGRSVAGRVAVRAIEHFDGYRPSAPARYLFVTYELAAHVDGGWSLPGNRSQPPGELQVASQAIGEKLARRTMRHFEDAHRRYGWRRYQVALRNGERAVVYPNRGEGDDPVIGFQVVTERTLIGVSGSFELDEIPRLAELLRPLTGP
jgi:hypothetical protein